MREQGELHYLFSDHLGSTSITTDASGAKVGELRYRAYGETRHAWGDTPTDFRYTGQREEAAIGLYFYNSRWFDPQLARFAQADTIVPNPASPMSLNRYMYVVGNPLRYRDPSGHYEFEDDPDEPYRPPKPPKQKPWWESTPPSIHSIAPGGEYGDGTIQWGDQTVSVYRPPTVRYYPNYPEYYPRHYGRGCGLGVSTCMGPYYTVGDYWWGEDYGNASVHPNARQDPVVHGTWETVTAPTVTAHAYNGRMSREERLAGLSYGAPIEPANESPDPSKALTFEGFAGAAVDALSIFAHQQAGQAAFMHDDMYTLQQNASGNYRVIIVMQYHGFGGQFYRTIRGREPAILDFCMVP